MIRSMTGFARVERQLSAGRLVWELRAVNHRYLDLQLRLPDEFRAVENDLRARGSRVLSRGKIEATLRFQLQRGSAAGVDGDRLRELAAALGSVGEVIPVAPPDALAVLAWPGVLREEAMDPESLTAAVAALFDAVIEDFRRTREAEGARIAEHLSERVAALRKLIEAVRARAPQVREAWLERLRGRIADLGTEVDPARLAQEAVLIAQRLDVDEEMSRLAGHLDEVAAVLKRDDAVGRRLDFLMQELNREANTLSSKSQDEETTRNAVEMKVLIEQMREQVQNVE